MRFVDRFAIDHPGALSFDERGVASTYMIGCPWSHHYEAKEAGDAVCGSVSCKWCWEREMNEERDIVLDDDFSPWEFEEC